MHDFLNRCRPFFQEQGLQILAEKTIAISGLGGVGGGAFLALVRSGCSCFRLAENGLFDPPDMNRQAAAFGHTMDRPKLDVYVELARSINPAIRIKTWPEGLQPENLEDFIAGADAHIGAIDVEKGAEVKRMTPAVLERCGVPMFTAGAFGFGSMMINYRPGGMMEDEFARQVRARSEHRPGQLASLMAQQFNPAAVAIFDRARATGPAPTTAIGCLLANTLLANEVIVHLLQGTELIDREAVFAPRFVTIDALSLNMQVIDAGGH
jgi:molybdopterin/thiamine biosynthesis adenylyltransferase